MKIFNIILFSFLVCACSTSRVKTHYLSKNDFSNINFIEGMKGCENLHLSKNSLDIFVTDLTGKLYLISGTSHENLNVVKLLRINDYVLGIDEGSDKYLYVLSSSKEWLKKGGGINKIDVNLGKQEKITFDFAGVNGLAIENQNNIYFTVGNMNMLKPKGAIYIMIYKSQLFILHFFIIDFILILVKLIITTINMLQIKYLFDTKNKFSYKLIHTSSF